MKTVLSVITVALFTASGLATAGETDRSPSKGENIGLGAGLVAGALLGGPPGAILGAALGTHYGGSIGKASKVPELEQQLQASEGELEAAMARAASLRAGINATERELQALNATVTTLMTERAALAGLHMDVLYTTGKADIGADAQQRLETLARVLKKLPQMTVELNGFADQRGSESFNAALSESRARSVEQLLVAQGVAPERIHVKAFGEELARAVDPDGYAMERRVTVRLIGNDGNSVAHNRTVHRHPAP